MTTAIEDVLPLSPLQQGLLFHTLYDPHGLDLYTVQLYAELDGPVHEDRLRTAARTLVARHANLRAVFMHEGLDEPVQVIRRTVEVPWEVVDVAGEEDFAAHYEKERGRRFTLDEDVLLRFTLYRLPGRHRIAITLHHILLDGWSIPLLLEEFFVGYEAGDLPPVAPYRDYLAWLSRQDGAAALAAWRAVVDETLEPALAGVTSEPGLPRLPHRHTVELSEEHTALLSAVARGRGWTLNTVVQVAWGLALGRLLGRRDVVFGGTVAGRPADLPGVERMIGLFINTLPVRVTWSPGTTLADLLTSVQRGQTDLMPHQFAPLAEIQRQAGRGQLFDTTLVFENYPADPIGSGDPVPLGDGVRVTDMEARDSTHYAVTVIGIPGRRLSLRLDHRPELVGDETAARLGRWLVRLLTAVTTNPDRPVSDVALIEPGERDSVLRDWNATDHPVPARTLDVLLEEQAAGTPDAVAVVAGDEAVTYAVLHERAGRVARHLIERGVGPGTVVAVALPRSVNLVVALLAVLKAGAAYLPIDPDLPTERVAVMRADAAAVLVLDDEAVVADWSARGEAVTAADRRPTHPDDLAYVIYTSGSTGVPKGVGVPHRGIVNRLAWTQAEYGLTTADRVLQKTSVGFDVSVWEFFWPLTAGAGLVMARPGGHRDPAYLAREIQRHRVTAVHFVPSMLEVFLAEPAAAGCRGTLRRVLCSGEALPVAAKDDCLDLIGAEVHNLYGPTEASVDVTAWPCARDETTVPIGRPVWNTSTYVLDDRLAPVPPGVPGELYLAGRQLARGYLGQPGRTAERFVADPYGPPGTRMYRTGDLARWSGDGHLLYLGRVDDQVKIRGQRIELGEIQSVLSRHPRVRQCAVLVTDGLLVAYVVAEDGIAPRDADLAAHLSASLPSVMVPAAFVHLDRLPVTASGKLDRRALPAPDRGSRGGRAAASLIESRLCAAFAEVLGLDTVSPEDDFFALGGHSLLAARLVGAVRTALGVEVPLRAVFEARTPAALVHHIGAGGDGVLPLRPGGDRPPLFCLPPAAGLSSCYAGMLDELDDDLPVFGLNAPDLSGYETIGSLAEHYAERIRAVRPHGPYRLLGWSAGGHLAHEVAVVLGGETELLVLLDAYPPERTGPVSRAEVFDSAFGGTGLTVADLDRPDGRARVLDLVRRELGLDEAVAADVARGVLETFLATTRAVLEHTPGVYPGDLLFFQARDAAHGPEHTPDRWLPYVTGDIDVRTVDFAHADMTRREVLGAVAVAVNKATAHDKEDQR
ncbi:amino acid adenylation domain-containing protein [Verrucosispora sp. WMMC514]|uniref:amino acid adenylation domain-containing protein n=1 Tax=Verrucosispora sp. WMMC514 TaxID=3015156 RepID=UPI00248CA2BB|nr:amino acid adenylation domain-containing protein [Verrucosispora sp. WMMC514]WBB93319.1 amino acid adenylation domain-containing protein [Verrucosispora sp. WMMC514]